MIVQRRGEEGVALILALVFLSLFGVFIAVLLGFSEASNRATVGLRDQRWTAYVADASTDGAIQYVRGNPALGKFGTCPSPIFSLTLQGMTAQTTCVAAGDPLSLDRTVEFTTTVASVARITAVAIYRDSTAGSGPPAVDVTSWTYLR